MLEDVINILKTDQVSYSFQNEKLKWRVVIQKKTKKNVLTNKYVIIDARKIFILNYSVFLENIYKIIILVL